MPATSAALQAAIAQLVVQVNATKTTEDGAATLINTFGTKIADAVKAALEKDNRVDQATIDDTTAMILSQTAEFAKSSAALGAAIANVPTP